MGTGSIQGTGNGQVPGFQEGGSMSQDAIDKMSNDQLLNLSKNGNEIDKKNAAAELMERLSGTEKGTEKGGEKGGEKGVEKGGSPGEKGGGGTLDDELKKILEKLKRGEQLTPEEEQKLMAALGNGEAGAKTPEPTNGPNQIGGPGTTGPGTI